MPQRNKTAAVDRGCYALSQNGRTLEINMYGQIVQRRPVNWWNGEEVKGDFIVQSEFLQDLDTYKDYDELVIHLNSVGGDAYASVAIYNRLKALDTKVTIVVDGVAMSGGSLIMCAGDTVKVNPSSIIMIHRCWSYVWDQVNADDLRKMAESFDATDTAQAEIYHARTGLTVEECLKMMSEEKYMSGREAKDLGFATELIEDAEDADIAASADHRTLFVNGRPMMVAMGKLPESIPVVENVVEPAAEAPEAEADGGDNNPPVASGENEGGHVTMTWEEFLAQNPEAAQAALANARAEGANEERQRLSDIDAVAGCFSDEIVNAAKYGDNTCTAQEMAYRAALASAKQGQAFMAAVNADNQESNAQNVSAAPAPVEEAKPQSNEDLVAAGQAAAKKMMEV